jgi:uncharacterized membrane protein
MAQEAMTELVRLSVMMLVAVLLLILLGVYGGLSVERAQEPLGNESTK